MENRDNPYPTSTGFIGGDTVKATSESTILETDNLNRMANMPLDIGDNTLELLAERPKVDIERIASGNVRLTKQVNSKTIHVPVTLTQEVLIIEHIPNAQPLLSDEELVTISQSSSPDSATIMVNGETITLADAPHEIILSQQVARVAIETLVAEKVELSKTVTTHEQQVPLTLRHEELVAEEVRVDNPTVLSTTTVIEDDVKLR